MKYQILIKDSRWRHVCIMEDFKFITATNLKFTDRHYTFNMILARYIFKKIPLALKIWDKEDFEKATFHIVIQNEI